MSKKRSRIIKQKGGNDDLSEIHLWGQDQSPPSSYKIQLGYIEIPKTIQFDEKWLDTPYRFKSFHDANSEADRIFGGYLVRVVGSNDHPYWDAPSYLHQNRNTLDIKDDNRWYDVVGIQPISENPYSQYSPMGQAPTLSPERQYALSQLSKLHDPLEAQSRSITGQRSNIEQQSVRRVPIEQSTRKTPVEQSTRKTPGEQSTRRTPVEQSSKRTPVELKNELNQPQYR